MVTLAEAIASAVRNNPTVLADERLREQAKLDVLEAGAVYDPRVRIETTVGETKRLTGDVTETGDVVGQQRDPRFKAIHEEDLNVDVGVSKLLRYGTQLDVSWTNGRRTTDAAYQTLSPEFDPALGMTVSQPLLKNFGGLRERTTVLLARNTSSQAASAFETALADMAARVVNDYWTYTQAEADLEVRRHALKLARELVQETQRRVEVGTLPPVAVREARADAASREEEVIRAENNLNLAARTLQYRVMLGAAAGAGAAPLPVRPAEQHIVLDLPLARDQVLRTAIGRRSEVRGARLAVDAAALRETVARNDLLPSLDLIATYKLLGLGGRPRDREASDTYVDSSEKDAYGDALDRMTNGDYYTYQFGLRVDVPLSNTEARARLDRESIEVRRVGDLLTQVVTDVALEVERAVGDVSSARERVQAARVARELAEENLSNQRRRYEVGMVTTTDVLEFQDRVTSAMAAEVQAITDHARAVARLMRAEGTLLERHGVHVRYEDAPALPWWSKF